MINLQIPLELSFSKPGDIVKGNEISALFENLAGYLWNNWQNQLIKNGIFGNDLWSLLHNKFFNQVTDWASGKLTWDVLVKAVIDHIESDERNYTFTFEIFPKAIFGLPDGNKLVVPSNMKVAFDSIEAGSFKVTKHGTLPIYRKEKEKSKFT